MGQLSDAIKEHLELKRRHGADEEDLSRQEAEALGPVRRETPATEPTGEPNNDSLEAETSLMRSPPAVAEQGSEHFDEPIGLDEPVAFEEAVDLDRSDAPSEVGNEGEPPAVPGPGGEPALEEELADAEEDELALEEELPVEEELALEEELAVEEEAAATKQPGSEEHPFAVDSLATRAADPAAVDLADPAEVYPEPDPAVPDERLRDEHEPTPGPRPLIDEAPVVHDEPLAEETVFDDEPLAEETVIDDELAPEETVVDDELPPEEELLLDEEEPVAEPPPAPLPPDDEDLPSGEADPQALAHEPLFEAGPPHPAPPAGLPAPGPEADDLPDFGDRDEPRRPPSGDPGDAGRFDFDA